MEQGVYARDARSRHRTLAAGAVHLAADLNMQTLVLIVSKNNAPSDVEPWSRPRTAARATTNRRYSTYFCPFC